MTLAQLLEAYQTRNGTADTLRELGNSARTSLIDSHEGIHLSPPVRRAVIDATTALFHAANIAARENEG